jgi:hypothetical protein
LKGGKPVFLQILDTSPLQQDIFWWHQNLTCSAYHIQPSLFLPRTRWQRWELLVHKSNNDKILGLLLSYDINSIKPLDKKSFRS